MVQVTEIVGSAVDLDCNCKTENTIDIGELYEGAFKVKYDASNICDINAVIKSEKDLTVNSVLQDIKPRAVVSDDRITINDMTGKLILPHDNIKGPFNIDSKPIRVIKLIKGVVGTHIRNVTIRTLEPPPLPPRTITIIKEKDVIQHEKPIFIRREIKNPKTEDPLIIRLEPPKKPEIKPNKILRIPGEKKIVPGRVIVENIYPEPPQPRSIIIERWLPYKQKTELKLEVESSSKVIEEKPKNIMIDWVPENPKVRCVYQEVGPIIMDPEEYRRKYGPNFNTLDDVPECLRTALFFLTFKVLNNFPNYLIGINEISIEVIEFVLGYDLLEIGVPKELIVEIKEIFRTKKILDIVAKFFDNFNLEDIVARFHNPVAFLLKSNFQKIDVVAFFAYLICGYQVNEIEILEYCKSFKVVTEVLKINAIREFMVELTNKYEKNPLIEVIINNREKIVT